MTKLGNTQTRDVFDVDSDSAKTEKTTKNTGDQIILCECLLGFLSFILCITDQLSFCMLFGNPIVHVLQLIVLSNKM